MTGRFLLHKPDYMAMYSLSCDFEIFFNTMLESNVAAGCVISDKVQNNRNITISYYTVVVFC